MLSDHVFAINIVQIFTDCRIDVDSVVMNAIGLPVQIVMFVNLAIPWLVHTGITSSGSTDLHTHSFWIVRILMNLSKVMNCESTWVARGHVTVGKEFLVDRIWSDHSLTLATVTNVNAASCSTLAVSIDWCFALVVWVLCSLV